MSEKLKSVLTVYSTILGGFYTRSSEFEAAMRKARSAVGDDAWKRGYTGDTPDGNTQVARIEMSRAGIKAVRIEGALTGVRFRENNDESGNRYPKLHVSIDRLDHEILLSVDIKDDVAQRLISKLDNCKPGQFLSISAWPTPVNRNGRDFVNHAVSVKTQAEGDEAKAEVPANAQFSAEVKKQTDAVEATLKGAGISDAKVIQSGKTSKRLDAYKALLQKIEARFAPVTA